MIKSTAYEREDLLEISLDKDAWRQLAFAPEYPCYEEVLLPELNRAYEELSGYPAFIAPREIVQLKRELEAVYEGRKFLLHIGDCAEEFCHSKASIVEKKIAFYLRMSSLLSSLADKEVLCLGRIGGQYAKPRSSPFEVRGDLKLPSYFGSIYNDVFFSALQRTITPSRILQAYFYAKETVANIRNYLDKVGSTIPFYLSHEGLNLYYESALTRASEGLYFNLSTHFPWIGWRSFCSQAHRAYFKNIENPIGIKVGAAFESSHLLSLLQEINPENKLGKIVVIYRFGSKGVKKHLSRLLKVLQHSGIYPLLMVDIMHGNTKQIEGKKVRFMEDLIEELQDALIIHRNFAYPLHGIHLEASSDPIFECLSRDDPLLKQEPSPTIDPRLNEQQSIKILQSGFTWNFLGKSLRQKSH